MTLIPDTTVAFPGFVTIMMNLFEVIGGRDEDRPIMPWIILRPQKSEGIKASETVEKDPSYELYKSLLTTLVRYLRETLPAARKKIKAAEERKERLYMKSGCKHDAPAHLKRREEVWALYDATPEIQWLDKHHSQNTGWFSHECTTEAGSSYFLPIISWVLMSIGVFNLDAYIRYAAGGEDGILPHDEFDAWEPLFKLHKINNKTLCEGSYYGTTLLPDGAEEMGLMSVNCGGTDDPTEFACFLEQGTLSTWMRKLQEWGYTRESAIEFFGVHGFFSNLYNDVYFGFSDEIFTTWIQKVVIPEFNNYFPKPEKKKKIKKK